MQFDFLTFRNDAPILFYSFYFNLIVLFYQSEQKTKSSIPAHSINYAILSIHFMICYFVFVIPYIYIWYLLYYVILIYRYLLFVYFFKNNTIPPPPVYIRMYPAPPRVCNCVPLLYLYIYDLITLYYYVIVIIYIGFIY